MILELNFLCFVRILRQELSVKNTNGNIYYFLIQSLGRILILIILLNFLLWKIKIFELFFFIFLLMKLGGAPFQFWYLKLIQKISWINIWLLSIWQKFIPLIIIKFRNNFYIIFFGLFRVGTGRLRSICQKKIKKILGLSSLFSLGWVLCSLLFSKIWIWFIRRYGIVLFILLSFLKSLKFLNSESLENRDLNFMFLLIFFSGLLIIRGIPPLIVFYLKILILLEILKLRLILMFILLFLRIFMIYIYLMIGFSLLTFLKSIIFLEKSYSNNLNNFKNFIIYNLFCRILIIACI